MKKAQIIILNTELTYENYSSSAILAKGAITNFTISTSFIDNGVERWEITYKNEKCYDSDAFYADNLTQAKELIAKKYSELLHERLVKISNIIGTLELE
jgi:hypothetical protein